MFQLKVHTYYQASRRFAAGLVFFATLSVYGADAPEWRHDAEVRSANGYYALGWKSPVAGNPSDTNTIFEVQQARSSDFRDFVVVYQGQDTATTLSGMSNGEYFYRVRLAGAEAWSKTLRVLVEHHELSRALIFLSAGAVVFIMTLIVVVKGPEK